MSSAVVVETGRDTYGRAVLVASREDTGEVLDVVAVDAFASLVEVLDFIKEVCVTSTNGFALSKGGKQLEATLEEEKEQPPILGPLPDWRTTVGASKRRK